MRGFYLAIIFKEKQQKMSDQRFDSRTLTNSWQTKTRHIFYKARVSPGWLTDPARTTENQNLISNSVKHLSEVCHQKAEGLIPTCPPKGPRTQVGLWNTPVKGQNRSVHVNDLFVYNNSISGHDYKYYKVINTRNYITIIHLVTFLSKGP